MTTPVYRYLRGCALDPGFSTRLDTVQMDNVNPPECNPAANPAKAAWKNIGVTPKITSDAIEIDIA
jgi:hypothetical protein